MKIEMKPPIHRTTCRVLYGDTDAGGVVYYGNYMRYYEIGRTEFMRDMACSYRELEERGFVLPVISCYSRYKAPARYDDLILIESSLAEFSPVRCRFWHRLYRTNDGITPEHLLAKGGTEHAVINRDGRITRFPADIYQKLLGLHPEQE